MFGIIALIFGVALLKTKKCWAPGHGPFDESPSDVLDRAPQVNDVTAASKRRYKVTSYQRGARQGYHVAQRTDTGRDWVSFIVDDGTAARVLWRANAASPSGLDAMKKDFAL